MEKIRLFGEIEDIPQNAIWEDVERRALTSPILRRAVEAVRSGLLTREQALIRLALWAANESVRHHDQMMDWINTHPQAPFLMPNPRQPLETCKRCGAAHSDGDRHICEGGHGAGSDF